MKEGELSSNQNASSSVVGLILSLFFFFWFRPSQGSFFGSVIKDICILFCLLLLGVIAVSSSLSHSCFRFLLVSVYDLDDLFSLLASSSFLFLGM